MVEVGERTGRMERVFQRLAEHYEQVLVLKRNFLAGIAWPMFQLTAGVTVIGLLIWILGMIQGDGDGPKLRVFGLSGGTGAIIWFSLVGAVAAAIAVPILAIQKGWLDPGPLFRLLLHVPGIGNGLTAVAMARLTWALSMATDSDLPPDKSIELAVRSTQNSYFTDMIEQMKLTMRRGGEMHDAFRATGRFPQDFLDTIQTGELSGRVSETLQILSRDYDERAKLWFRGLTVACGFGVFLLVAAVMIVMIFQVAQIYLGTLNEALQPM
jgi:type IV pilus assembly protein PilC